MLGEKDLISPDRLDWQTLSAQSSLPDLHPRYATIAIVSHPRHLTLIRERDDTLVFATEWLAWLDARQAGFHAIHFETLVLPWPADVMGPLEEVGLRAGSWVYDGRSDMTVFRGVSLGQMPTSYLMNVRHNYERLWVALDQACRIYRPDVVVLFDATAPFGLITDSMKRLLAREAASRYGVAFEDKLDPVATDDPLLQTNPVYDRRPQSPRFFRSILRGLWIFVLDVLSRLRLFLASGRPRVFIFVSALAAKNMISAFERRDIAPIFNGAITPKSLEFVFPAILRGIAFLRLPNPTKGVDAAVTEIVARIESVWCRVPVQGPDAAMQLFLREKFIANGELTRMAYLVASHDLLIRRHNIRRIVNGDIANQFGRMLCDLARQHGIEIDETQNGMFITHLIDLARSGDSIKPATMTRLLAFGPVNMRWLACVSPRMQSAIAGCPALDCYRRSAKRGVPAPFRRALIFPGHARATDVASTQTHQLATLVGTIDALRRCGLEEIRLKLKESVDNPRFYRRMVERFGLKCEIVTGPLPPHFEWADMAVGPATSGAFLECTAAGLPYYVLRPLPSAIPDDYLRSALVFATPEDLEAALKAGLVPDRDKLLADFAAFDTIANSSRQIWRLISDAMQPNRGQDLVSVKACT